MDNEGATVCHVLGAWQSMLLSGDVSLILLVLVLWTTMMQS